MMECKGEIDMAKRMITFGACLLVLVLSGCTTTPYDFGKTCIYDPDSLPSFTCQFNEPGKEWV